MLGCSADQLHKEKCDANLQQDIDKVCSTKYPGNGVNDRLHLVDCLNEAKAFKALVKNFGDSFYNDAQKGACDCCCDDCPTTKPATRPATEPGTKPTSRAAVLNPYSCDLSLGHYEAPPK